MERVACLAAPDKSYSLYLPSSYLSGDPGRRWPILYLFDARGRAPLPLGLFREGAERFGMIVVSSYDTRSDGPLAPNLEAIQAIVADTHRRFAVDPKRRYAAGFSGGGRLAAMLGFILKGSLAGVISCGAGFAEGYPPTKEMPFAFFGTIGDEDFNYQEMRRLERTLTSLGSPHRIAIFRGGHRWPEAALCTDALDWMELQAARQGLIARDTPAIDARLARELERVAALLGSGHILETDRALDEIVRDFDSLRDLAGPKQMLALELSNPSHRKLAKEDERRDDRESALLAKHEGLLRAALTTDDVLLARLVRDLGIEELRKSAAEESDPVERLIAIRLLESLFVRTSFDLPHQLREKNQPARAALSLSVAAAIRPSDPRAWYDLACAQAVSGARTRALASLTRAVELGLPKGATPSSDPDFESLRKDPTLLELSVRAGR